MGQALTWGNVCKRVASYLFQNWSSIRPFANSYAAKATLLVSAVGYLLLLNRNALEWAELAPTFRVFWPETPWRLVTTYYGLVLLAAGSLIFQLRCPSAVRTSVDIQEFLDAVVPLTLASPERTQTAFARVSEKLPCRPHLAVMPDFETFIRLTRSGHPASEREKVMAVKAAMALEWYMQNSDDPISRCACTVLLTIGTAIFLIPAAATFIEISIWSIYLLSGSP